MVERGQYARGYDVLGKRAARACVRVIVCCACMIGTSKRV